MRVLALVLLLVGTVMVLGPLGYLAAIIWTSLRSGPLHDTYYVVVHWHWLGLQLLVGVALIVSANLLWRKHRRGQT